MGKHFLKNSIDDQYEKARIGVKCMTLIRREATTKKNWEQNNRSSLLEVYTINAKWVFLHIFFINYRYFYQKRLPFRYFIVVREKFQYGTITIL